jgi:pilus assembly protein CpaB
MRLSSVMTVLLAVMLAGAAGFLAQQWLEQQRRMGAPVVMNAAPQSTIVVAARPLRFGSELTQVNLREMEWPSGGLPAGAFARVADLLKEGDRRLALAPIEPNEPVLAAKITGPGQRATLSSLISPGMKAITIRVNDVNGVAGFVLPGDRIDVMLTRKTSDAAQTQLGTEVLLQDVRVLGIDQLADERADKARVVRAVTVEVTIEDAQRVVLASSVGSLSLALRAAGASGRDATGRVTPADLSGERSPPVVMEPPVSPPAEAASAPVVQPPPVVQERVQRKETVPFGVTRSVKRFEYSVPAGDGTTNGATGRSVVRPNRPISSGTRDEVPKAGQSQGVDAPAPRNPQGGAGAGGTPQSWLNSWSVRTIPDTSTQR